MAGRIRQWSKALRLTRPWDIFLPKGWSKCCRMKTSKAAVWERWWNAKQVWVGSTSPVWRLCWGSCCWARTGVPWMLCGCWLKPLLQAQCSRSWTMGSGFFIDVRGVAWCAILWLVAWYIFNVAGLLKGGLSLQMGTLRKCVNEDRPAWSLLTCQMVWRQFPKCRRMGDDLGIHGLLWGFSRSVCWDASCSKRLWIQGLDLFECYAGTSKKADSHFIWTASRSLRQSFQGYWAKCQESFPRLRLLRRFCRFQQWPDSFGSDESSF